VAASLGAFKLLEDDDTIASHDAESVAVLLKGSGGLFGVVVVEGCDRVHAVEHGGEVPVLVLACTPTNKSRE